MFSSPWSSLVQIRPARSRRASTWDQTGRNMDCIEIKGGETAVLADIKGAGMITHIYFTLIAPDPMDYRDAVLRMFWDGENTPSVEVPFGDFFCISNCVVRRFDSYMVAVNPGGGPHTVNNGINCYFPMPFADGARIEIHNESDRSVGGDLARLWCHIDYEEWDEPPAADVGRFHAQWRRENPTVTNVGPRLGSGQWNTVNLTGEDNYVMLEAKGEGHIAGLFLEVDNIVGGWYGEGDDMMFIDGDVWPPSQHGTGSEEVFGGGACPDVEYAGPYTGFLLVENKDGETFKGKNAMYRWYVHDPIRFRESVKMTIEHGHGNDYANDYSSVAYWYQHEPHATFPVLPALADRRPIWPDIYYEGHAAAQRVRDAFIPHAHKQIWEGIEAPAWIKEVQPLHHEAQNLYYTREFEKAAELYAKAEEIIRQNQG